MNRRITERFKNFIILTLFLTSLIQVGILWNTQNHGLPISFLSGISGIQTYKLTVDAADATRTQYFSPYRIIVSEGFDGTYWLVNKDSQDYIEIWASGKDYLKGILNNTLVQGEPQVLQTSSTWPGIFEKTAVIIDFQNGLPKELLSVLLSVGKNGSTNLPTRVSKIVISPLEDINLGLNTIYLVGEDVTYKYVLQIKSEHLNKQRFIDIIDKYSENNTVPGYISEKAAFDGRLPFKTSSDLLLSAGGNRFEKLKTIFTEPPEILKVNDPDEAARLILGDEKFSYYNSKNNDDTIEIKNSNNSYRFDPKGLFEYKYLQTEKDFSNVNVSEAYENTVKFMETFRPLIKGSELYLSEVKEDSSREYFEFVFDYRVNGLQVYVENINEASGKVDITNAIRIRANNKRVLSCTWLLKNFSTSKEKLFNINYNKLIDKLPKEIGKEYPNNFSIGEIDIGYRIKPAGQKQEHDAVWGVHTLEGIHYTIEMESK